MKNVNKRPLPIVTPPSTLLLSRKRARKITTQFHSLTSQIAQIQASNENEDPKLIEKKIKILQDQIEDMGGRKMYQIASQLSTKYHSTSRWVLRVLGKVGWLQHGILIQKNLKNKQRHRPVRLLEIGAINTELLQANGSLNVTAIDLRSSHPDIQEADFLSVPIKSKDPVGGAFLKNNDLPGYYHTSSDDYGKKTKTKKKMVSLDESYDTIVCSVVLNSVTNPSDRGRMLLRMHNLLNNGGFCFITLPKLCLTCSKYMNRNLFENMMNSVGFQIHEKKESPKIAFWVFNKIDKTKVDRGITPASSCNGRKWKQLQKIRQGKRYSNDFAVILPHD